jgi:hypothetical protein
MTSKFAQIIFGQNFQIWQTLGDKVCFVLAAPIWAAKYGATTLGMMTLCLTTLSKTVENTNAIMLGVVILSSF